MKNFFQYLIKLMITGVENEQSLTQAQIITAYSGIFVIILFLVGLFLFVYLGKKKDQRKQKIIDELLAKDPELKVEYRYFIDFRNRNDSLSKSLIKRSILTIVLYFVVFEIVPTIVSLLMMEKFCADHNCSTDVLYSSSELYNEELYNQFSNQYSALLQFIVYFLLLIVVVIPSLPFIIEDAKKINKKTFLTGLLGLAAIYGASIVCAYIITMLGFTNDSSNEEAITGMFTSSFSSAIIISLVTIIIAPIVEELVYRKAIFNLLGNKTRLALVISSLIFGGSHVLTSALTEILSGNIYTFSSELIYLLTYTSMGLVLGLSYLRGNRNIFSSIFTHMLNNLLSVLLTLLSLYFLR